jgi:hypothetical protein
MRYRIQRYPVHFPIYDPENNDLGFRIEDRRPYPLGTTGFAYWDDTQLVPGSSSLIGTPSGSGVHPWGGGGTGINTIDVGNANLMNTWSFGAVLDLPIPLPFFFRCDNDNDGIPNNIDIDDDNDGILDKDESPGVDGILDSDGDGVADFVDFDFPGFVDANFNGINDNFDTDGDRIINQFDLDSDNDGIPDVVESYGVDNNGDGRIDNYSDTDNDGLSQNVDLSNVGETGSVGLGEPDLDGDGIPNYLDKDSDNDGIPDIIEAVGVDANNNGLVDDLVDLNNDGVASPYLGESLPDSDFDGLANSKDPDLNNDGVIESPANALLLTSTDVNNDGRPESYPYKNFDMQGLPNAYDLDSDNDGISDLIEAGLATSDADGMSNGAKGADGWDDLIDALPSLVLPNTDGSGGANYIDIDADADGIPDNIEGQSTAGYQLPSGTDSDGDGLDDSYDATTGFGASGITPHNQDNTDVPDYLDTDTDNDTIIDLYEGNDLNNNGIIDDIPTLAGTDTDADGLDDFFDNNNSSIKGTSLRMGNAGALAGDASPGSITTVQRSISNPCAFERDWRCALFVLPIEIRHFSGSLQNNTVTLYWEALQAQETIESIRIERSSDGVLFSTIGILTGKRQTLENKFTNNVANTQAGKLFYRITIQAVSGKKVTSRIITIEKQKNNPLNLTDYVTTAGNTIEATIFSTTNAEANLKIINSVGQILLSKKHAMQQGRNTITFHKTANLEKGIFFLQLSSGNETKTVKFYR